MLGSHRLYVGAEKTATWDDNVDRPSITFDSEPVVLEVVIVVEDRFKTTVNVVPITKEESRVHHCGITADDCFAHLELGFKFFFSLTNDVHGLLGQTCRDDYVSRLQMSSNMPIMGGEHKFTVSSLFSTDCGVTRFGSPGKAAGIAMATEKPVLSCESGMRGSHGIVCKK